MTLALALLAACGGSPARAEHEATRAAEDFLNRYVDDTGRVVRHDQGGDTVSEGQAYALLLADAINDRRRFELIWKWTKDNLQRRDHLFSWHWDSGVTDRQPAADADLDTARALVLAGKQFDRTEWTSEGVRVGRSVLDRETLVVHGRRILLPAPSRQPEAPVDVNVSYISPVAFSLLADASNDPRWSELADGSRELIASLPKGELPPDWVTVQRDGSTRASSRDSGGQPGSSYDAIRTPIRLAESCTAADRRIAGGMATFLADSRADVMKHSVGWVARAASSASDDRPEQAGKALAEAAGAVHSQPSYYGDAWNALGRFMLLDGRLGGCPPKVTLGGH